MNFTLKIKDLCNKCINKCLNNNELALSYEAQINNNLNNKININQTNIICTLHKKNNVNYCEKCKIYICEYCILNHKNHKIIHWKIKKK